MKKLAALLACLLSASSLFAAITQVQSVISRTGADGKSDLVGAPTATVIGDRIARAAVGNIELLLLAVPVGDKEDGLRIHARLIEKSGGKTTRVELPPVVVLNSQSATTKADGYQVEFSTRTQEPPSLSINFPGGTLGDFSNSLPKDGAIIFNLVGEKADLATEIPSFSLRPVSIDELVGFLNKVLAPRSLSIVAAPSTVVDFTGRRTVYLLQRTVDPEANLAASALRLRTYQLENFLTEKQSVDAITDTIRTAWAMMPDTKPENLNMKFHPGTNLLLVTGSADAIRTVETVIGKLVPQTRLMPNPAESATRLQIVADEVRTRRALRQAGALGTGEAPSAALDRVEQAIAEARQAAPSVMPPTATATPEAAQPPESFEASKARLDRVAAEVQARRLAREQLSSPPAPQPQPPPSDAPANSK